MTYATLPLPSQKKPATRQYLTEEQVLCLVDLVKERNKLLENKKDSLILDEERIRIKGDRAFNALAHISHKCPKNSTQKLLECSSAIPFSHLFQCLPSKHPVSRKYTDSAR
jgi:hypothetical protein